MKKAFTLIALMLVIMVSQACKNEDVNPEIIEEVPEEGSSVLFSLSNAGQAYGKDLVVDSQDNFYYTSLFQGQIDGKSFSARGPVDNYFAKHSATGDLLWEASFGAPGSVTVAHSIETDAQGNVYLAGYFGEQTDPNGIELNFGQGISIHSQSGFDAFLVKYDANANPLWAITLGNNQSLTEERAWDLSVSSNGDIYIAGAASGQIDFNPLGVANTKEIQGIGHFIAKYNTNGENQWAKVMDANIENIFTEGYTTLDTDDEGNLVVAAVYRGDLTLDGFNISSSGLTDILLASFEGETGNVQWLNSFGGTGTDIVSPGAMRVNKNGEAHLTGRFSGTSNMGGITMTSGSAGNSFLLACDRNGNKKWLVHHESSFGLDGGHRVDFDQNQNVYVAGWYRGTTVFGSNNTGSLTSNGTDNASDVYLTKYSSNGELIWASGFGALVSGGDNLSICAGLGIDSQGNAIITGKFYGSDADFNPNGAYESLLTSSGMDDCFVAKYNDSGELYSN